MTILKWIKAGKQRYVSECGRFAIISHSLTSRPDWTLHDHQRRDACQPIYNWSEGCVTLASAKRKAQRIVNKEQSQCSSVSPRTT